MNLKIFLTCPQCNKILKDPILLPCGHATCNEHLQRNIKIDCKKCFASFETTKEKFMSIAILKDLLDSDLYLSDEEKFRKSNIEKSWIDYQQLNEEFLNASNVDFYLQCERHFKSIRHSIDEQQKINLITAAPTALQMKRDLDKFENVYIKKINKAFEKQTEHIYPSLDLEKLKEELKEILRDPFLDIDKIKGIEIANNKSLDQIRSHIYVINDVRDHLVSNKFYTNVNVDTFGILSLNPYESNLTSEILLKNSFSLIKLCEFSSLARWSLLYRASEHGFTSEEFHKKCDGHAKTLTIFKTSESQPFVFGGYTEVNWDSDGGFREDFKAFLFSFDNKFKRGFKIKLNSTQSKKAIKCDSKCGPSFGGGDIYISTNSNLNMNSYSVFPKTYQIPLRIRIANENSKCFLAGLDHFKLSEIEVFEKGE